MVDPTIGPGWGHDGRSRPCQWGRASGPRARPTGSTASAGVPAGPSLSGRAQLRARFRVRRALLCAERRASAAGPGGFGWSTARGRQPRAGGSSRAERPRIAHGGRPGPGRPLCRANGSWLLPASGSGCQWAGADATVRMALLRPGETPGPTQGGRFFWSPQGPPPQLRFALWPSSSRLLLYLQAKRQLPPTRTPGPSHTKFHEPIC